jgi:hypothetical protein
MTTRDDFLFELSASLRGPRRRRQRLVDELAAHIDDALRAELTATQSHADAQRIVLDRVGPADAIANRWNADRRARRKTQRRRLAVVAPAIVAASALGVTQYAAGTPQPPKRDGSCKPISADAGSARVGRKPNGSKPESVEDHHGREAAGSSTAAAAGRGSALQARPTAYQARAGSEKGPSGSPRR